MSDAVLPVDLRPLAYRWLSRLLADAPVQKTLEGFADAAGQTLMNALGKEAAFRALIDTIRGVSPDSAARQIRAVDLAVSYGRLFQGAAGAQSPRPCQSAYPASRDEAPRDPLSAMTVLLTELNLTHEDGPDTPADHVAVQFAALAELAAQFAHSRIEGDRAGVETLRQRQIAFIDGHLLSWLPAFISDCGRIDDVGFYTTALGAAVAYLERDRGWLERQRRADG